MPPKPDTEPTAPRGTVSEGRVNMFAAQAWCAEAASPTRKAAGHSPSTCGAKTIGTTKAAQISIASLRAFSTPMPREMKAEDSQPPAMLPASVIR
jgi:hypothetical protein